MIEQIQGYCVVQAAKYKDTKYYSTITEALSDLILYYLENPKETKDYKEAVKNKILEAKDIVNRNISLTEYELPEIEQNAPSINRNWHPTDYIWGY